MGMKNYISPLFMVASGGSTTVTGEGTGQGTNAPQGMSYDDWYSDIAWDGDNPDADYNGDGAVNQADYDYYNENQGWNP